MRQGRREAERDQERRREKERVWGVRARGREVRHHSRAAVVTRLSFSLITFALSKSFFACPLMHTKADTANVVTSFIA